MERLQVETAHMRDERMEVSQNRRGIVRELPLENVGQASYCGLGGISRDAPRKL